MIDDTQLEHWKTKAEASEILKCSEKTISRLAAQKRIQKLMRRNPGRRAQPVFSPDDIEALRGDQDQIEAFPGHVKGHKAVNRLFPQACVICASFPR